jgi:spore germination protein GerM
MGRKTSAAGILWISAASMLLLLAVFLAWGCDRSQPPPDSEPEEKVEKDTQEESGMGDYDLTLYFRYSADMQEMLAPQERAVTGVADPYRAAMEELIAGPAPDSQLFPVLPDTVKVLDIEVADGIATVNVSKEILTDANQVGVSAAGEGLALSAIANTLTEFDEVSTVRLLIEGMQSGMVEGRFVEDFWGHIGLPEYLERNEDIIFRETPP